MKRGTNETILVGRGSEIISVSDHEWKSHLLKAPERMKARLGFMTEAHRRVRCFVVEQLPRYAEPISPEFISRRLNMPIADVIRVIDDLERHLFFLVRNESRAVAWAFPVTVDQTPHRVLFSTGEVAYAA